MGIWKVFPFGGDECDSNEGDLSKELADLGSGELALETTAVLLAGDLSSHSASTVTRPAVGEWSTMYDAMYAELNRIYVIM